VAYDVCHVVPVTVCNQPECTQCSGTCANGDCGNSSLPPASIPSPRPATVAPPKPAEPGVTPTYGTEKPAGPLQTIPPVTPPEEAPKNETPGPKV
jgi:hypothetical protein